MSFLIDRSVVNLNMLRAPTKKLPVQLQNDNDFYLNAASALTSSSKNPLSSQIKRRRSSIKSKMKKHDPPSEAMENK